MTDRFQGDRHSPNWDCQGCSQNQGTSYLNRSRGSLDINKGFGNASEQNNDSYSVMSNHRGTRLMTNVEIRMSVTLQPNGGTAKM